MNKKNNARSYIAVTEKDSSVITNGISSEKSFIFQGKRNVFLVPAWPRLKLIGLILMLFFNSIINTSKSQNIYINEILSSNSTVNIDPEFYANSDWIEIYNAGSISVDLSGYCLTDDLNDPLKWKIPGNTIIQPGSYLIFWADGQNTANHTNFKLSRSGEQVGLFNTTGILIDSISYYNQLTDISFGRQPDGSNTWKYFTPPTPNLINNSTNYIGIIPVCRFSPSGGFYSGTQTIEIINDFTDAIIRYTLDGSDPTTNSQVYSTPVNINSTTVIRAKAFKTNYIACLSISQTYFINEPDFDLPVISLSTDHGNFYDDTYGIYTAGTNGTTGNCSNTPVNWNQNWERPINIEMYDESGDFKIQQNAGTKIYGACSRTSAQKSLAIISRSIYGKKDFDYKLFKNKLMTSYRSFVLRNSGNDWGYTLFRDAMMQAIVIDRMDIDFQAYQPVVTYFNGEYWGYIICEKK